MYGRLGLPVDTTSRASRRACSESRFPVRLEGDVVVLKDTPIHLSQGKEKVVDDNELAWSSPERSTTKENMTTERSPWDPHCIEILLCL
jgi:hypothetical protein